MRFCSDLDVIEAVNELRESCDGRRVVSISPISMGVCTEDEVPCTDHGGVRIILANNSSISASCRTVDIAIMQSYASTTWETATPHYDHFAAYLYDVDVVAIMDAHDGKEVYEVTP